MLLKVKQGKVKFVYCLIIFTLFTGAVLSTQTYATQVSGDQSGTWTLAGSPYELIGDVRVPPALTLTVEPGVQVIGMGNYKITVDANATLTAVGTDNQLILFTASDQNTGWRGIVLESASDNTNISYCILEYAKGTGDYPAVRGGALMVKNCSPIISHNTFRFNLSKNANRNGTGGGVCTENSPSAQILYNLFYENQADSGGAICITEYGTPLVKGNVLTDNTAFNGGGGMYFGARSTPLIENNLIMRNHSSGWGGGGINCWNSYIYYNTYPTIRNNVIAYNTAYPAGGGLYCRYDRAILTNNLIAFNNANYGGGIHALNQGYSAPIVTNCIVWGNTGSVDPQIDLEESTGSQIYVTYSDVQDGYVGAGNINADPFFVDADGADNIPGTDDDNYRLDTGSPCIDAGDNYALDSSVTEDYDGNPRYVDDPNTPDTGQGTAPIIDIGPFEYQASGNSFTLYDPVPGLAGQMNALEVSNAPTSERIYYAYGLSYGSTPVPGCTSLVVEIRKAQLAGTAVSNNNGNARLNIFVPHAASGHTVYLQAVEILNCTTTNLVIYNFP